MAITPTGHAEIDQQHDILDSIVGELAEFCSEDKQSPNASCSVCGSQKRQHCIYALASVMSELRAFLVGHVTYEEKMMELLPDTPRCRRHVEGHKSAHAVIARRLKSLLDVLGTESPKTASIQAVKIVKEWLGDHIVLDTHLARHLEDVPSPDIDFDGELVAILDEYVFHKRPTKKPPSAGTELALQRKKLEVRGRFESLSPTQREVFWLVVSGNKNREIASQLGSSINTIKSHRAAVFQKMEVSSVLELVKKADVLR